MKGLTIPHARTRCLVLLLFICCGCEWLFVAYSGSSRNDPENNKFPPPRHPFAAAVGSFSTTLCVRAACDARKLCVFGMYTVHLFDSCDYSL
jgi:hypothetical protein